MPYIREAALVLRIAVAASALLPENPGLTISLYVRQWKLDTYHSLRTSELGFLSPRVARYQGCDGRKTFKIGIEDIRDE